MDVRIGVVGTAYWANTVHTLGVAATPGAKLAGVWGRNRDKAGALARERGTRAFDRFEDMLAAVDAVSFAVPPGVQEELALQAIAAGKHVLLEKPIATSYAKAQAVAAAVRRADRASIVFFTRRFVPEVAEAIERNAGRSWKRAEVELRSAALAAGSPYEHSTWRRESGGSLWDIGPHVLSVLIAMLGPVALPHRARAGSDGNGLCHSPRSGRPDPFPLRLRRRRR
ncbi:MAG: Gfo/Idh/MocA family oxidoreductase [Alphaproteobacteria bacterium]|nr:Gfo/Idh/MocA family oxidoreductase [Alphaproteobacteria bacterium]